MNTDTSPVSALTTLSPADQQWRRKTRQFAEQFVQPLVAEMDRAAQLDQGLLKALFEQGLMGVDIPTAHGGASGDCFQAMLVIEELARVDPAVSVVVDVQNMLVNFAVSRYGSEAQKERYLPLLAQRLVGAFSLTEKESGSDAFAMASRATAAGDGFILQGTKRYTTNAAEAGVFVVLANTTPGNPRGVTAFLLEREQAGLQVGRREDKMGIRASSTCDLHLNDVRVGREVVLGGVGGAYAMVIDLLNKGRIGIAAQMLGLAQGALEHAVRYARRRRQFGEPIANFQAVQCTLANMSIDVEAARLLTYNAARLFAGRTSSLALGAAAARAKQFAAQAAERVASQAVEIFGGSGFTKEAPVEKLYRDAKIGQIYEGTTNILLRTIAACTIGEIC